MSLKDTIDKTNTKKENAKIVAKNIDAKLVESGGEEAINLADVRDKIEKMAGQYKKIAIISPNISLPFQNISIDKDIKINLDFLPKIVFIEITPPKSLADIGYGDYIACNLDSNTEIGKMNDGDHCQVEFKSITKNNISICIYPKWYNQRGSNPKINKIWAIE